MVMCHSDIKEKTEIKTDDIFICDKRHWKDILFYFKTGVSMDVLETLDHNRKRPRGGWYFFLSLSNFFNIIT